MSKNDSIILNQLKKSNKAQTAYEILDEVRLFGIKSPPQVYRSLTSLIKKGKIHKVESLNAFTACPLSHENLNVILLVCDNCSHVDELDAETTLKVFSNRAKEFEFSLRQVVVEIKGLCKNCRTVSNSV